MPQVTRNQAHKDPVEPKGLYTQEELSRGQGGGMAVDIVGFNGVPYETGAYSPSDSDEGGNPEYFGFLASNGDWYIMRINTTGSSETIRYAKGSGDYDDAWDQRATQTYGLFADIF